MTVTWTTRARTGVVVAALGVLALLAPALVDATPAQAQARGRFALEEATIADIHKAFQTRQLTCRELVEHYLDRIEAYDEVEPAVNSIILVNPAVLETADALDAELAEARGNVRQARALHCVPLLVKDNYDTADMPTTGGSLSLEHSIPPDDAQQVRALRAAGAIVIAKTNMAEFAWSAQATVSSLGGTSRNPYDRTRVTAGSSGGTAASVAANFGMVGLGTDTGNSIRGPSSHQALVGIRSTMGLTSRDGIIPLFLDRDIGGPMARTVEDAVKVFDAIAGYDPADPVTAAAIGNTADDYTDYLDPRGLRGARIGVWREVSNTDTADPQVLARFEEAIDDLEAAGATIVDPFVLPDFDELRSGTGCNRFHADIENYLASLGPGAPFTSLEDLVDSGLYDDSIANSMRNAAEDTEQHGGVLPDCDAALENRAEYREAFLAAVAAAGVDAVVYPTWNNPPRLIGDSSSPSGNNSGFTAPQMGLPAITVPMGFTYGTLPAGLQLLGMPFGEPDLIRFAYAYEQATQHRVPPADFPPLAGEPTGRPDRGILTRR